MRFYTKPHRHYCRIDLHARTMYVCILNQDGVMVFHRNLPSTPEAFLRAIASYREGLVVADRGIGCSALFPTPESHWRARTCLALFIEWDGTRAPLTPLASRVFLGREGALMAFARHPSRLKGADGERTSIGVWRRAFCVLQPDLRKPSQSRIPPGRDVAGAAKVSSFRECSALDNRGPHRG